MRPTFLGFETARKGLAVSQKGIDVTGQNIVNINTEGYTRQRVDQVSMTTAGYANRYADPVSNLAGQGVKITGVGQIRDNYLDSRFREEIANTSYYEKAVSILDGIEAALDEVSSVGLGTLFNQFILDLQEFSKNPLEVANANIVMSSAKNVTQVIRQFNNQLDQLTGQQKFDLQVDIETVNMTMQKIAALNKQIADEQVHNTTGNMTYGVNELVDQRNLLLDDLASFGNIRVINEADGTVTVTMNEKVIIAKDKFDKINLTESQNDHTVMVTWESTGSNVILESGALKANIDLINGVGGDAKGVQYYKDQLDLFANTFAAILNTAFTVDDAKAEKMQLIGEKNQVITAANIKVNSEWLADSSLIIRDTSRNGDIDTTNILKLIDKLQSKHTIGSFRGTLFDFVDNYNTTVGQDKNYMNSRFEASLAIANDLNDRRDSVSAVVLDEEGANLMLYEKAYQAASRLMTALDEALDILINRTGRVGL